MIENYVCILMAISSSNDFNINDDLFDIPSDLCKLIKSLISEKCLGHNDCLCSTYFPVDQCMMIDGSEYGIYSIHISDGICNDCDECNDECNNECCEEIFKQRNFACAAKYCKLDGTEDYLDYSDICFSHTNNINEQINKYVGFKNFLNDLLDLLS
jgi:hypothetical protein